MNVLDMQFQSLTSISPYVPPRAGWSANPHAGASNARRPSPAQHMRSGSGDNYYEDVEPRFAEGATSGGDSGGAAVPSALMAGRSTGENPAAHTSSPLHIPNEQPVGEAPRSPAVSDISHTSHFTSISERPINPRWQPPPPMPSNLRPAPQPRVQDMVLQSNPDFELPVGPGRGGTRRGRGGFSPPATELHGGGRYPTPPM